MSNFQLETPTIQMQIESLAIGETLQMPHAKIARVRRQEFVLHADYTRERARWGTSQEIAADARFFLTHGRLPAALDGRW